MQTPDFPTMRVWQSRIYDLLLGSASGMTPLHYVAGTTGSPSHIGDRADIAALLIEYGADVNAGYGDLFWTPLGLAEKRGKTVTAEIIKAFGGKSNL